MIASIALAGACDRLTQGSPRRRGAREPRPRRSRSRTYPAASLPRAVQTEVCRGCEPAAATWRLCHSAFDTCVMTVSGDRRGGCDEDKDLVGGAIGRDIVGCWRSLLAPQRERTIGCSANLRLIGEKRARRGHAPGIIGSNTAGAGALTATSTDGGRSTVRAAASAGAHTDASAAGPGPVARATDSSTDGSNTASAGAHTDACAAGRGPVARATDSSISSTDGSDTIIPLTIILLTGTNAG